MPGVGATDALALAYRERCATLGREVRISLSDGTPVEGVARDVDASGAWCSRPPTGRARLGAGDVVHLR